MKISINGKIVESRDAAISVHDRGYLFGEGVFETLRTYDGRIPFFDKHLARIEWSATFVGIPFPHPGEIRKSLEELLAVAMHDGVDIFDSEPVILGEPMAPLPGGNECLVIFV